MVSALPKLIITGGNTTEQPGAISYLYDPEGQLVREVRAATVGQDTPPANVTLYLADKNLPFSQILEERDGVGVLKAAYTFGDAPIKQVAGGVTSFFHGDHLSTKFIAAANGEVQARFSYSPYGETKDVAGGTTSLPIATTVHQFARERLNADTRLYYNRARWMDPGVGRFVSLDSYSGAMHRPKSLHDYAYANFDPIDFSDPSGRQGIGDIGVGQNGSIIVGNANLSAARAATLAANKSAGKGVELTVRTWLEQSFGKAAVGGQRPLFGPGGKRVCDALVTVADRLVIIESKFRIPTSGSALKRLNWSASDFLCQLRRVSHLCNRGGRRGYCRNKRQASCDGSEPNSCVYD
ncbi:MAG: RHS repeat-associated core domain-containing protein [Casimicrobiaceae bacterium]